MAMTAQEEDIARRAIEMALRDMIGRQQAEIERLRPSQKVQEIVRQYREAWRDCIDAADSEASHREGWDGSDHNLRAFDDVMDFVLGGEKTDAPDPRVPAKD